MPQTAKVFQAESKHNFCGLSVNPCVQPKLEIGSPNDIYEKEADAVADKVMMMPSSPASDQPVMGNNDVAGMLMSPSTRMSELQMKCEKCKEEDSVQMKPSIQSTDDRNLHTSHSPSDNLQNTNRYGTALPDEVNKKHRVGIDTDVSNIHRSDAGHLVQRRLVVHPTHHSMLDPADPASSLSASQRFAMIDTLVQGLCPEFEVDPGSGEVLDKSRTSRPSSDFEATSTPGGCCCLHLITDSANTWTVAISELDGPQTIDGARLIIMSSSRVPIEFGSFTSTSDLAFQGEIPAFGHELCGHAVLMDMSAHPPNLDRTSTDVHDPTVRIENMISSEQGVPASELRGLARSGSHRGESVDRIVVSNFPLNGVLFTSLPTSEQAKVRFAAAYILANNSWVDVIGHTDRSGSNSVNDSVSQRRADNIKRELNNSGVPNTISKLGLTNVDRFTRVEGVRDRFPPRPPLNANARNWRRVEILIAGFPAGAQNPVAGTPSGVTTVPQPAAATSLAGSSDPCIVRIIKTAYAIP